MEFEDILVEVGGFGKYQKQLIVFFIIPVFWILPCFWLNFLFMLSVPEHWCRIPELELQNITADQRRTIVSPPENPSCTMYSRNYSALIQNWNTSGSSELDSTTPCDFGWEYDKKFYDATASTKYNLVCEMDHFPSLLYTLQNIASLVFTPIFGSLSDKYGRKVVFMFLSFFIALTELLSVCVNHLVIFAVMRTLNGVALPTMFMLPYIIVSEIVSPEMRGRVNGIINCSWSFGLCFLPLVAYLARHWILLGILSTGCGFAILLYWKFLPESPSWLVSRGKYDEAADIIMEMGQKNGKPQNRVHILTMFQVLGEKIEQTKVAEKNASGLKLFKYSRLRRNFLILAMCWTAFLVSYSGLTYNVVNLGGNEFLNFFWLSVVEFPGNMTFWFFMDRFGRRWTTTVGLLVMGLASLVALLDFPVSAIVSSMACKFCSTGLFMVVDQQAVELFPTVARSFLMGCGKTLSTAFSLMSPFIAYLSIYGKWIPFVIVSLVSFVAGALSSLLPETLNENLPQTATDANGFGRDQAFFSCARLAKCTSPSATCTNGKEDKQNELETFNVSAADNTV